MTRAQQIASLCLTVIGFCSNWALATTSHATPAKLFTSCSDSRDHPDLAGSLCSRVTVPLSYDKPDPASSAGVEQIELFVRKFPYHGKSRGSVWIINGGPGESGATSYSLVASLRRGFPQMDIFIPDHRGTGYSSKICSREEAPDSVDGIALGGAEWGSCFAAMQQSAARTRQFSISNAAHDLRALVFRFDDHKPVYLYGVSYGTQLILRTLQLGTLPVKGVILDSLVPTQTNVAYDLSQRSHTTDDVGRAILRQCDLDSACHAMMGDRAAAVYGRLLDQLHADPERANAMPRKDLKLFLSRLLDFPATRARLPWLIKDLSTGKSAELEATSKLLLKTIARFGQYRQSPASIPLTMLISGSENTLRPEISAAQVKSENARLLFTSDLPGYLVAPFGYPTYAKDPWYGTEPTRFPPVLVLQGGLDPKTPYAGALLHINALRLHGDVQLVTVPSAPHFILAFAPTCFEQATRAFVRGHSLPLCE
jgi:pimeloyl-ACP methyl ester carboxylesterase